MTIVDFLFKQAKEVLQKTFDSFFDRLALSIYPLFLHVLFQMIICLTLLYQKHRKDVEGLRISLKYSKLSVLVFISIVFHSKKRYNISKTDIFDLG